jgi:hypothetical protein
MRTRGAGRALGPPGLDYASKPSITASRRAKIAAEARLDGRYLLSTSDPDLSAGDVALGYKNLLEAD